MARHPGSRGWRPDAAPGWLIPPWKVGKLMGSLPELPDIVVYIEALERRVLGQRLVRVRIASPFLVRTAEPPLNECAWAQQ